MIVAKLDDNTRKRIGDLYRVSLDSSGATEAERTGAKRRLDALLTELGLTIADAERINADQQQKSQQGAEPPCTPREMVDVIIDLLREYVWHPDEDFYLVAALWILHTHVYRQFRHTARLIIYAQTSHSGKSTLMTVIRFLSAGGDKLDDPSSASLFREIARGIREGTHTKFIDEMDLNEFDKTFYRVFDNGWIQGGHVKRVIGKDTVTFDVHAPLCFGSISKSGFTPQNLTRSFLMKMHKKGARETKDIASELFPTEDMSDVRELIDQWAITVGGNNHFDGKLNRSPLLPPELLDRDKDRWRPLLSIADACGVGEETRKVATSSAFAIARPELWVDLVVDIKIVFDGLRTHQDRIWSEDLVEKLHDIHESPWGGEFCGFEGTKQPHKLSKGELGHALFKKWEIKSQSVRIGSVTKKGYYRWQFEEAWSDAGVPSSVAVAKRKPPRPKKKPKPRPTAKKRHNGTAGRKRTNK
jgi:hypothetical protein